MSGAADIVAVDAGQVAVEDDDVVVVLAGQAQGGGPVVGDVDGHALAAQAAGDGVGHDPPVFHHEQSHGGIVACGA